jgi:hypothetical protein
LTTGPASGRTIGLLVVLFVVCNFGFSWRSKQLGHKEVLDVQGWYTCADAYRLLDDLGPEGRKLYARTELTLDLVFPIVYACLFIGLIGNLYPPQRARALALVPLLGWAADWCENAIAVWLALTFETGQEPGMIATLGAIATLTKSSLFVVALVVVALGGAFPPRPPGPPGA